jgi:hypothetical protein
VNVFEYFANAVNTSWLGIHQLPDQVKALKRQMHTDGAAIKAAPSVRPNVGMYALKHQKFF